MSKKEVYIGIDVGSVSVNLAIIDGRGNLLKKRYIRTSGAPINAVRTALSENRAELAGEYDVAGAATTGSGRHLIGYLIGADEIKNEITAHAVGAMHYFEDVSTIIEIGGQDSKIIIIENKIVVDFAMNTICAAGTGSFLDQQAQRLGIDISEFGGYALESVMPTKIAGRCGVFAESDMIHKQQIGYPKHDIIAGLCFALVNNYLNNVGRGKKIGDKVVFQGGVAANRGIVKAFGETLNRQIFVPGHYDVMGAIGAALIALRNREKGRYSKSKFKGPECFDGDITSDAFECAGCSNRCEIISVKKEGTRLFNIGGRCGKYDYKG